MKLALILMLLASACFAQEISQEALDEIRWLKANGHMDASKYKTLNGRPIAEYEAILARHGSTAAGRAAAGRAVVGEAAEAASAARVPFGYNTVTRIMTAGPEAGAFQQVGVGIAAFFGLLDLERTFMRTDEEGYLREPTAHEEQHPASYTPYIVDFDFLTKGRRGSQQSENRRRAEAEFYSRDRRGYDRGRERSRMQETRSSRPTYSRLSHKDEERLEKIRLQADYYGALQGR